LSFLMRRSNSDSGAECASLLLEHLESLPAMSGVTVGVGVAVRLGDEVLAVRAPERDFVAADVIDRELLPVAEHGAVGVGVAVRLGDEVLAVMALEGDGCAAVPLERPRFPGVDIRAVPVGVAVLLGDEILAVMALERDLLVVERLRVLLIRAGPLAAGGSLEVEPVAVAALVGAVYSAVSVGDGGTVGAGACTYNAGYGGAWCGGAVWA